MNKRRKSPFEEDRFADQRAKTRVVVLIAALVIGSSAAMGEELPVVSRDTIATGLVFAYGHELEPPYVLEIVDSTLRVNGVQVYPDLGQYDKEPPPSGEEISEWTKRTAPIYRGFWDLVSRLKEEGRPISEITAEVADYLRRQEEMVDSVTDVRATTFLVHWKDGSEEVFTTHIPRREKQTEEEQLQNELRRWQRSLRQGWIIVAGSGGSFSPPWMRDEVAAAIARARAATPEELKNWTSRVFGRPIAEQFRHPWSLEETR